MRHDHDCAQQQAAPEQCDIAVGAKLLEKEILLKNLNNGGGLGFVAGGKVIDKRTLRMIFAAKSGFLSTVLPLILALQPTELVVGTDSRAATAAEIVNVRATFTCLYVNLTVGSLLKWQAGSRQQRTGTRPRQHSRCSGRQGHSSTRRHTSTARTGAAAHSRAATPSAQHTQE